MKTIKQLNAELKIKLEVENVRAKRILKEISEKTLIKITYNKNINNKNFLHI